jgi:ComF family protein
MIEIARQLGSRAAEVALDFVVPNQCPTCNAFVHGTGLCAICWQGARFIVPPFCARCGLPFDYDPGAEAWCGNCLAQTPPFEHARAAMTYDEISRGIILAYKHGDRLDLTPIIATWVCAAGKELLADADAVIPVPMHPRRLFQRRYNQAAVLAQAVGRLSNVDVMVDVLRRTRSTPSQGGLGRKAREKNLRGAIVSTAAMQSMLVGRRLLLIDDVLTTGATVAACSRALLKAGALRVDVLTLARVI